MELHLCTMENFYGLCIKLNVVHRFLLVVFLFVFQKKQWGSFKIIPPYSLTNKPNQFGKETCQYMPACSSLLLYHLYLPVLLFCTVCQLGFSMWKQNVSCSPQTIAFAHCDDLFPSFTKHLCLQHLCYGRICLWIHIFHKCDRTCLEIPS